jgi:predicted histidine transporter YuiF (NhaC family)
MDVALAVVAGLLLAVVAFRRGRRVVTPEARRAAARQSFRSRSRRVATATLTVTRVAVGVAALAGIVWLTKQLFK